MKIPAVGIDLAKNAFQIHGIDELGKAVLKANAPRSDGRVLRQPVALLIGMEACGRAHYCGAD